MPTGVFVNADGSQLHDPNGNPVPGILVQYEDDDEHIPDEDPADWGGRAVVPAEEYMGEEDEGPDATDKAIALADEHGIDLEDLAPGSGKNGRVLKGDVQNAVDELEDEDGSSGGGEESSDEGDESDEKGAIDFASDEAAEAFFEANDADEISPAELAATEPSGKDEEYTVDDVESAKREEDEG